MEWNTNQVRRVVSCTVQLGLFYVFMCAESRRPSILPVPESYSSSMDEHEFATETRHSDEDEDDEEKDSDAEEAEDEVPWLGAGGQDKTTIVKGFPPTSPYIGVTPTLCYLLKEKKQLCCLQLCQVGGFPYMSQSQLANFLQEMSQTHNRTTSWFHLHRFFTETLSLSGRLAIRN